MPGNGQGPPDGVLEEIPGRAAVAQFATSHQPPFRAQFAQGDQLIEAEFADIRSDRGGEIVELHFDDGRYVTVHAPTELRRLKEVR